MLCSWTAISLHYFVQYKNYGHRNLATKCLLITSFCAKNTGVNWPAAENDIKTEPRIYILFVCDMGGSVAEWLACWTQAQKGPGSNRSRDAVG